MWENHRKETTATLIGRLTRSENWMMYQRPTYLEIIPIRTSLPIIDFKGDHIDKINGFQSIEESKKFK